MWPLSIFVLARIIPLLVMVAATYICILELTSYFDYPGGCDWFGYSRQARLFQERGSVSGLNTAITDSVTRYVIEKVKSLNLPEHLAEHPLVGWYHAIGPHCHNYKPDTDQLVLQYPPGTGWLLSFFKEGVQARSAFIFWMLAALAICLWNAIDECSLVIPALATLLYFFCLFSMWYFLNDWSIPGSVVSAVLAAYCIVTAYCSRSLYRHLLWIGLSGLALGLSANFRVANILLIFGFAVVLGWGILRRPVRENAIRFITFFGTLAVGALPTLAANTINAGRPFATPYPLWATEPLALNGTNISTGLRFYSIEHPVAGALVLCSTLLLIVVALLRRRLKYSKIAYILSIASLTLASNVVFFILYFPRNGYYICAVTVFATAIVLFAVIASERLRQVALNEKRHLWLTRTVAVIFAISVLAAGARLLSFPIESNVGRPNATFEIRPTDVIWSASWSGPINYFLRRQAGLLCWADPIIQNELITAIFRDGRRQLIVDDDCMRLMIDRLKKDHHWNLRLIGQLFGSDVFEIEGKSLSGE